MSIISAPGRPRARSGWGEEEERVTRKGKKGRLAALSTAAGLAVLAELGVASPGLADTVVGCAVTATISFTPNGPGTASDFGWTMHGGVSGCQSNVSGAPTDGVVSMGESLTVSVPITLADGTVVQGTAAYQEPSGSGFGYLPPTGCTAANLFTPVVFVQWSDGTITEVDMSIVTVGALAQFQGFITTGAVLQLIPGSETPAGTAPDTYTVFSDNPSFDQAAEYSGVAVVATADAADCVTAQGLQSAQAVGAVQFGEPITIPRPPRP